MSFEQIRKRTRLMTRSLVALQAKEKLPKKRAVAAPDDDIPTLVTVVAAKTTAVNSEQSSEDGFRNESLPPPSSDAISAESNKPLPSADSVLAANRSLNNALYQFKLHSAQSDMALRKSLEMLCIGIILDLAVLEIDDYKNCVNNAAETPEFVTKTIDDIEMLISKVEQICLATSQFLRKESDATKSAVQAAKHTLAIDLLNNLRQARALTSRRHNARTGREKVLTELHAQMRHNFVNHFQCEQFGELTEKADGECDICREKFSDAVPSRTLIIPMCCPMRKMLICIGCFGQHAFVSTDSACTSEFACPSCYAKHRLYPHLPLDERPETDAISEPQSTPVVQNTNIE